MTFPVPIDLFQTVDCMIGSDLARSPQAARPPHKLIRFNVRDCWLSVVDGVEAKLSLWNEDNLVSRAGE